jgi:hypothetical protein
MVVPTFQSHNHEKHIKLQTIALELSNHLETGLSDTAVEAVVDLLLAGTAPDTVLAMVEYLQQRQQS